MDDESILFVQPRYHTNLHPTVEALVDRGHDVSMLVFRDSMSGESEVTEYVDPDVLQFTLLTRLIQLILGDSFTDRLLYLYGLPAPWWYLGALRRRDPDVVVVRNYSATALLTALCGRLIGSTVVYYDQTPANAHRWGKRRTVVGVVHLLLFGRRPTRYSPVRGSPDDSIPLYHSYYIPFAMEPVDTAHRNETDTVRVVMIGKLHQPRKNHLLFLRCIDDLATDYDVRATIIGSLASDDADYYQAILSYVADNDLKNIVDVESNLPYDTVQRAYETHDIFVLPSDDEPASVSHLEAMAHGLAVICSDANGTKEYVEPGYNGYHFEAGNYHDLRNKLDDLVRHEDKRRRFGDRSLERTRAEFSQARFYDRFSELVADAARGSTFSG
jgi:glycosyltransferase involved in cell wall biosynthesis